MSPSVSRPFQIEEHSIDEVRPVRVLVIGAGISGLICAIRLPQRIENLTFTVYEKNADVGGTWFENRYPGCACDIPSHSYQLTFEPNKKWSKFYAPAREIEAYWQGVAKKYDLYRHIQLNTKLVEAKWDDEAGKWKIVVQNTVTGERTTDEGDFLITCVGFLNNWKWPDIPDLEKFKGYVAHTAAWKDGYDFAGKKVALIGSGSSAIQVLPTLQPTVAQIDNYVRGKTWIGLPFAGDFAIKHNPNGQNFEFTPEVLERFQNDPEYHWRYRKELEVELNAVHGVTQANHEMQKGARVLFDQHMRDKLAKKPEIAEKMIPAFPVACKRLTPGPGYLEALVEDNVEFVHDSIKRFTEAGIETVDGKHREYDAIICATGFDTSFRPRFPLIGLDNVDLREKYKDEPDTYMSLGIEGFPNLFMLGGPNSGVGSGSLTVIFEKVADYTIKAIKKTQLERIKWMVPSAGAVRDFMQYVDAYFVRTVFGQKCKSWYKNGKEEGRVVGLWPGSCLHAVRTLENPRWEDYEYVYLDERPNRFGYLGDGWTEAERNGGDTAFYMEEIDYPPVPQETMN
jgi:cation diffusion facilitator CzcD-associated flavoprotein CzcO